jgi:hypothetical protein
LPLSRLVGGALQRLALLLVVDVGVFARRLDLLVAQHFLHPDQADLAMQPARRGDEAAEKPGLSNG